MRTRILAALATTALLTLGVPGIAGATCTEVVEGRCLEDIVCPVVTDAIKQATCIE